MRSHLLTQLLHLQVHTAVNVVVNLRITVSSEKPVQEPHPPLNLKYPLLTYVPVPAHLISVGVFLTSNPRIDKSSGISLSLMRIGDVIVCVHPDLFATVEDTRGNRF